MIIESLNEYLEAVAGYIHDDDRLVTYKWLSKKLEVHVNVAKQILWEFWQKYRAEDNITSTVMLMGFLKDGGMRVEVVNESNLSKAKEKFSKIISEHVYSLQKVLRDISLLAFAGEGDVRYSAIKCDKSVEHTEEELTALRWGAASKDHIILDKNKAAKALKKAEDKNVQQEPTKEKPEPIKKSPKTQQAGFSNFFGKSTQKHKSPPTSSKSSENKKGSPSKNKKGSPTENKSTSVNKKGSKSGIDSFFNKNVHNAEDKKNENVPSKSTELSSSDNKNSSPEHKKKLHQPQERKQSPVRKETKQKKNVRGIKRDRSREDDTVKKRKRIIIDEDSSDTDPFVSDTEEPMDIPPSPGRAPSPKAKSPTLPPVKHEGGKRRVLKIVDKTFQDEDGYLVTQKVHVYESCSEDEAEAAESKPVEKPDPIENKNKKKVQSTLMSFFKK